MRLNCAIFDMDGTVLDSTQAWVQATACVLTRRGKTPPEDFSAVIRPMDAEQLVTYFRREYLPEITLRQVSEEVGAYMMDFYSHKVQPKLGVKKFLSLLKMEGVQCYLATATDRTMARAAIVHAGLEPYFKGIITSGEIGKSKSNSPAIYEWAMKRMRGSKLDTVVFEDALFAIRTAKEAGFRVAAVYDRDSEEEQGEIKALADYYITSFEELYEAQTLG